MTRADSNHMGSLVQALEHQSTLIGDKTALLQKVRGIWVSLTWSEYFAAVAEVGEGLVELGVGVGDKVVTLLANSTALVCTDVATQSIGAVSVPLVIETRPDEVLRLIAELRSPTWKNHFFRTRNCACWADLGCKKHRRGSRSDLQKLTNHWPPPVSCLLVAQVYRAFFHFRIHRLSRHPNPLLRSFLCTSERSSCLSALMRLLVSVPFQSIQHYLQEQLLHFLKVRSQRSMLHWRFCHISCIRRFNFCNKLQQNPNEDLNRIMV